MAGCRDGLKIRCWVHLIRTRDCAVTMFRLPVIEEETDGIVSYSSGLVERGTEYRKFNRVILSVFSSMFRRGAVGLKRQCSIHLRL